MKNKNLIIVLTTVVLTFYLQNNLQAQNRPQRPNQEERIQQMKENLDLNEEQSKKLDVIYSRYASTLNADGRPNKELMDKMNAEIMTILTSEQQAKLKEMRPERGSGGGRGQRKQN